MADYLKIMMSTSFSWEVVMMFFTLLAVISLSVFAYLKASRILTKVQTIEKGLLEKQKHYLLLEKKIKLLETLHDERLSRLKAQIEIVAIASQTSYIFKFSSDAVRKELKQFETLFLQLEQIEKLSYECEVNSENLYREAESWGDKVDPKTYDHVLTKADMLRKDAKKQLGVTKFIKDQLRLYELK